MASSHEVQITLSVIYCIVQLLATALKKAMKKWSRVTLLGTYMDLDVDIIGIDLIL